MKTFLVEKTNDILELLSLKDVRIALQKGQLDSKRRIYDDSEGGWIPMAKHPCLQLGGAPILRPPKPYDSNSNGYKEWYYLSQNSPVGPFSYMEMLRLFQANKIPATTIVWRPGIPNWAPAHLLNDFQKSTVEQLFKSGVPAVKNYFQPRRFKRIPYAAKFVLHDEEQLWKAVSFELSAGGVGLLCNSDDLKIGQEVFLHQTSRSGGMNVNAVGVVRNKSTQGMQPGQAKFGIEFVDISRAMQSEIIVLSNQSLGRIQSKISR